MRHIKSLNGLFIPSGITPDTLASNYGYVGINRGDYLYTSRRILGITRPIKFLVDYDDSLGTLYYQINAGYGDGTDWTSTDDPLSLGFESIVPLGTIIVNRSDFLDFGAITTVSGGSTPWVELRNQTRNNQLFQTIDLEDG